jgi:NTP pyrophosphatase (non-canonical NTP hydrolase)
MNEKLLKNINHYGIDEEKRKVTEEADELREAITEYEFAKKSVYTYDLYSLREHIIEEIADVQVVLNQFKLYYRIPDEKVRDVMIKKIDRQMERIGE